MKKLYYYVNQRVELKNGLIIPIIITIILLFFDDHPFYYDLFVGFVIYILIVIGGVMEYNNRKAITKQKEKRYGDDPEWNEYKRLKNKFNNA